MSGLDAKIFIINSIEEIRKIFIRRGQAFLQSCPEIFNLIVIREQTRKGYKMLMDPQTQSFFYIMLIDVVLFLLFVLVAFFII
jgi:hypothetical protein